MINDSGFEIPETKIAAANAMLRHYFLQKYIINLRRMSHLTNKIH